MNNELIVIIICLTIIISLIVLFFKKVYRKGEQIIRLENNSLEIDNYKVDILALKKIVLSSTYCNTVSPVETELVVINPIFDPYYRWRSSRYTFDMVQFNLDQRPKRYLYLWYKNKREIEEFLKSILNINKNIKLEGEGLEKLNLK